MVPKLTKKTSAQLQTFINRGLGYILGVQWPWKNSNEELWQRARQEKIETTMRRGKSRWIGHTEKTCHQHHPLFLEWNLQVTRRNGMPKKS